MKPKRKLLALPLFAAGIAAAVFLYTDHPTTVIQTPQPVAETTSTAARTAQLDPSKLSILPRWLQDCFDSKQNSAPTIPNPLDPSTWSQLPNPLDPGTWPQNCFGIGNLLQQVPDWLDPSAIEASVQQHIAPQDWNQAQQLIQQAQQVGADPVKLKDLLAKAWGVISKNWWLLVVILVVIGVIVIVAVASSARGGSQYVFDLDQNDRQNPGNHVRQHINIKDDKMCDRINDGSGASVNSSFTDDATAARYIAATVQQNLKAIRSWASTAPTGVRRAYRATFNKPVGRGIDLADCPNTALVEDMYSVRVIVEADSSVSDGFTIFNAFPEF